MADTTFIQTSRVGRACFQLRSDRIEVSRFDATSRDKAYPFRRISPDYERGHQRFHELYLFPGIVALVGLAGIILLWPGHHAMLAELSYPELLQIGGVAGATMAGFLGLVIGIPRVEYFAFYDHWRRPLFVVIREKHQAEQCDDFVRVLLDRIDAAQNDNLAPTTNPPPALTPVQLPGVHQAYIAGDIRWQISLILGGLSAGLPLIPGLDAAMTGMLFFLVLGCSVGGMTFAWFSYQRKERFRHLALVGAMLSLVAPLFY